MAKSHPKQSRQRGSALADALGRSAVVLGSLFVSLTILWWSAPGVERYQEMTEAEPDVVVHVRPVAVRADSPEVQQERRVRALAEFLAKRYRISQEAMAEFVVSAFDAGKSTRLDPLLLLAVMAVESRFNPIAESVMGAKGLMQIIPRHHADKFRTEGGGEADVLDPETNILAGARILREYIGESGDLAAALRRYGGGVSDAENQYAAKVIGERERLEQFLKARPTRA